MGHPAQELGPRTSSLCSLLSAQKQFTNRSETGQKRVRNRSETARIGNRSETGQKRVRNRSETGQKRVRNRSETGQKQVRNGSETGQKRVRNTSETGQKQVRNGSETARIGNRSETCQKQVRNRSETARFSANRPWARGFATSSTFDFCCWKKRRNLNYRPVHTCSVWSVVSRPPFLRPIDYGPWSDNHCNFLRSTIFDEFHEQSFKQCLGSLAGIIPERLVEGRFLGAVSLSSVT